MEICSQHQVPASLPPGGKPPSTHWIGVWTGIIFGADAMEKRETSLGFGRPVRSVVWYYGLCVISEGGWVTDSPELSNFCSVFPRRNTRRPTSAKLFTDGLLKTPRYDSVITKIRIWERYNFRWAYHLNATFSWVFSNSFTLKVTICIIKLC